MRVVIMVVFLPLYMRSNADNDLITIADDSDFAHAREYAQRGVVKMVVYGTLYYVMAVVAMSGY